jgi:hypothetical protein
MVTAHTHTQTAVSHITAAISETPHAYSFMKTSVTMIIKYTLCLQVLGSNLLLYSTNT